MPKADQIEKKRILRDGEDIEGFVNLGEYSVEDDVVDVPGLNKTIPVRNGVEKIPQVPATFKIRRNSPVLKQMEDWYYKKETHDVVIVRIDASGAEFKRELWPDTEVSSIQSPGYDAASPVFAQVTVNFLPGDIIPVDAEG